MPEILAFYVRRIYSQAEPLRGVADGSCGGHGGAGSRSYTAVNASVADVVVPGETGLLVPPQRPDLLADAVRYLIDRPAVAARMAVTARARLGERFGERALRDALEAAYVDRGQVIDRDPFAMGAGVGPG